MDLNGDGINDIISGSWPGELFYFEGTKGGEYLAPVMIKDKDGKIINIGGGISDWREGGILIKGNADFETTDEGTFVNYNGERLESTAERPIAISGTASSVSAADWDGDGDYDLIVGDIGGGIYLIVNEGTAKSYAFGKEKKLRPEGEEVRVNSRAGVCAVDWDGDGKLDLLVGDYGNQKPDLGEPTAEEKARHEEVRKELEPLNKRVGELVGKLYGSEREKDKEKLEAMQEEYSELSERTRELRSELPTESESHGWVWLFVRK